MPADEHQRDYDAFFLQHLQSVRADGAWYINHHFIGKGGNGTTFFVTCTSGMNMGVQFALKVFHKVSDEQRRQRFLDEVRHYKALSHPSIIRVYDEGTFNSGDRQYPFAVVDYVPTNLEAKLGVGPPQIARLDAVRYVSNVAAGVSYLHSQSNPIVHRDIKPANILVSDQGARLGDLGLAKVLMGEGEEIVEDVASYIAMPRFYRTPELVRIARGENVSLTVASDIYQLGLVLYRSVTGFNPQKPVTGGILDDIELDVRPVSGAAGSRLTRLVYRMLRDDPSERPVATDVLNELGMIHKEVCQADHDATGVMR
jgi:serine/threonine protein kinase